MAERRRRSLCFRCDGPYSLDHICPTPNLHVIMLGNGDTDAAEEDQEEEGGVDGTETILQLSLQSMAGNTSSKSLKLWGTIKGRKVVVLIDTGASHNFLGKRVAEELGLEIDHTRHFIVKVGDGYRSQNEGVCKGIQLQLPSMTVMQDFYVFNLGGVDVVLGYTWLAGLGDIQANFKEYVLRVPWEGQIVEIRGDPALVKQRVSYKNLGKTWSKGEEQFYLELGIVDERAAMEVHTPAVAVLLSEFKDVFQPLYPYHHIGTTTIRYC